MFSSCSGYGSGAFIAKRSGISTMVDRESFHDFSVAELWAASPNTLVPV